MFEQGLTQATELPPAERHKMLNRLDVVRGSLRGIGWGVADVPSTRSGMITLTKVCSGSLSGARG
jgi:hypothetical protein